MKILKITHVKMTLFLFQWVGFFFQIKNVEDIERCFLRLWDKNKTDQLHIETTICIERNIVMEFAQDQLNSVSFSRNFSNFHWKRSSHYLCPNFLEISIPHETTSLK